VRQRGTRRASHGALERAYHTESIKHGLFTFKGARGLKGRMSFPKKREGVESLDILAAPQPPLKKESGVESLEIGRFDLRYFEPREPGSRRLLAADRAAFEGLKKLMNSLGLHVKKETFSSNFN
jgi:hypothetical protein